VARRSSLMSSRAAFSCAASDAAATAAHLTALAFCDHTHKVHTRVNNSQSAAPFRSGFRAALGTQIPTGGSGRVRTCGSREGAVVTRRPTRAPAGEADEFGKKARLARAPRRADGVAAAAEARRVAAAAVRRSAMAGWG
jgi:hypothetical protein